MLGLVARADDRGLGILTADFAAHMKPDRVLVIDVPASPLPSHLERYPGATVVTWDPARPALPRRVIADFLDGLTCFYSAETFYDPALPQAAAQRGVRAVLHVMPEFARDWPAARPELWAPTPWRLDHLPAGTPVVPVPVPVAPPPAVTGDRFPGSPLRIVHVAGNRAAGDRNGTEVLTQALRHVSPDVRLEVRIAVQRGTRPALRGLPRSVKVTFLEAVADRWALYAGADVLVMPRRYGGLCLPAQEAMAAGLALVMPETAPNAWWPATLFPCPSTAGHLKTSGGMIPMGEPDDRALASVLEVMAGDPDTLAAAKYRARAWADAHSWAALLPEYEARLR